jgi:hypothetical protein
MTTMMMMIKARGSLELALLKGLTKSHERLLPSPSALMRWKQFEKAETWTLTREAA